jgi:hypothetical protein
MIYELRVYQPLPGQMPKLLARFRDKLLPIFLSAATWVAHETYQDLYSDDGEGPL